MDLFQASRITAAFVCLRQILVERFAPIVHINQKYPIYNYCRPRLIYIKTLQLQHKRAQQRARHGGGNWQRRKAQLLVSNRLLNCVMTVTDESDIYIRLGVVQSR